MGFVDDITKPFSNITKGIGSAIGSIGGGIGTGIGAFGKGVGSVWGGMGKLVSSPMTLIVLCIAGVVALKFLR